MTSESCCWSQALRMRFTQCYELQVLYKYADLSTTLCSFNLVYVRGTIIHRYIFIYPATVMTLSSHLIKASELYHWSCRNILYYLLVVFLNEFFVGILLWVSDFPFIIISKYDYKKKAASYLHILLGSHKSLINVFTQLFKYW